MRMKVLLCSAVMLLMTAACAYAYDFHLLNGMVIKGELKGFRDGVFEVAVDFGSVMIEASKLDYIVVAQGDGHAQTEGAPGVSVESKALDGLSGPEPVSPVVAENAPPPPEPLMSESVPPAPLENYSLGRPEILDNTPVLFKGDNK